MTGRNPDGIEDFPSPDCSDVADGCPERNIMGGCPIGFANLQTRQIGVPRTLPVRDIPARSLTVSMADQSQGHGNGSR